MLQDAYCCGWTVCHSRVLPGMFSHVTPRSLIPARNPTLFRSSRQFCIYYLKAEKIYFCTYFGNKLLRSLQKVFVVCMPVEQWAGRTLVGTYLVRFSTRTKIWPTKKTGRMIHILRPLACAAALTQQVKLSLGSTQALYNLYNLVESEVEDVGVNCGGGAAVYQSFCWRVAANMRCDQVQEVASIISHCPFQTPK